MAGNQPPPDVERELPTPKIPIARAVVDAGRRHVFYRNKAGERFNMVALHRMNMHYLRKRLIDESAGIFANGEMTDASSEKLTMLMRDYCAAVKDREFMRDWYLRERDTNPFVVKAEHGEMERSLLHSLREKGMRADAIVSFEENELLPRLPGWPWDRASTMRTRRERFLLAVLGGLTIAAPMVFMAVVRHPMASLATVSVCTVLFSVGLAFFFPNRSPTELLTATAAYAAVLAVFVGGGVDKAS